MREILGSLGRNRRLLQDFVVRDLKARYVGSSMGLFWSVIFPLMRPAVATMVILNTFSVWNDFANPQIILGPSSGLYTITTGIYAAVGEYSTDYTVVFPTLLLAAAPPLIAFVLLQRYIIGGLSTGAVKG